MSGKRSLIYGVGINDWKDNCSFTNNKGKKELTKEYKLWRAMITRCYSDYTKSVRPTYIGVTLDIKTGLFKARCGYNGTRRSLGLFETKEEAFGAYLSCKKKELKRLADKHKEFMDYRVYMALINYEFTLED